MLEHVWIVTQPNGKAFTVAASSVQVGPSGAVLFRLSPQNDEPGRPVLILAPSAFSSIRSSDTLMTDAATEAAE